MRQRRGHRGAFPITGCGLIELLKEQQGESLSVIHGARQELIRGDTDQFEDEESGKLAATLHQQTGS